MFTLLIVHCPGFRAVISRLGFFLSQSTRRNAKYAKGVLTNSPAPGKKLLRRIHMHARP